MADLLTRAMDLADSYAHKRARCAAYPFITEEEEAAAEKEREDARAALKAFLAEHVSGVVASEPPKNCRDAGWHPTCVKCANGHYEQCLYTQPRGVASVAPAWRQHAEALLKLHAKTGSVNVDAQWCEDMVTVLRAALGVAAVAPAHLQDEAAPVLQCTFCGRKSWTGVERGLHCNMPQPNGERCIGTMIPPPGVKEDQRG